MKPVNRKIVKKNEISEVIKMMTPTEQSIFCGYKLSAAQKMIKDGSSREMIKSMLNQEAMPMKMSDGSHVIMTAGEYIAQSYVAGMIKKAMEGDLDSDEIIKMQKILGEDKQVIEVNEKKSLFGDPIDVKVDN